MTDNEHNEQSQETTNPFIAEDQERDAEKVRLGLGDFDVFEAHLIQMEAEKRIGAGRITDEAEKIEVYEDVKRQRKEYDEYRERKRDKAQETPIPLEPPVSKEMDNSENPFIMFDQGHNAELERWGLTDLSGIDQAKIWHAVSIRVRDGKITDITEQRRIADEVKMQYQEYRQAKAEQSETKIPVLSAEEHDAAEYQRGYQDTFEAAKEHEKYLKSAYHRGRQAGRKEIEAAHAKAGPKEDGFKDSLDKELKAAFDDLVRMGTITELREELKKFDERLRNLEKYTEK